VRRHTGWRSWTRVGPSVRSVKPVRGTRTSPRALGKDIGGLTLAGQVTRRALTDRPRRPLVDRISLALYNALLLEETVEVQTIRELQRHKGEFLAQSATRCGPRSGCSLATVSCSPRGPARLASPVDRQSYGPATKQLARMIDDLAGLRPDRSGRFALKLRRVEMCEIASRACESAARSLSKPPFITAGTSDRLVVRADADRIQQVAV